MCKLFVGASNTVLYCDFASGGSLHFPNNIKRHFKPFKSLLSNSVFNRNQIKADFLFV